MHRALSHLDIVTHLVDSVESRATLVALSSLNRLFSEVSLDKLWSRLDNLYALAKVMRDDIYVERDSLCLGDLGPSDERWLSIVRVASMYNVSALDPNFSPPILTLALK
jgi:hypothetical protein